MTQFQQFVIISNVNIHLNPYQYHSSNYYYSVLHIWQTSKVHSPQQQLGQGGFFHNQAAHEEGNLVEALLLAAGTHQDDAYGWAIYTNPKDSKNRNGFTCMTWASVCANTQYSGVVICQSAYKKKKTGTIHKFGFWIKCCHIDK